MANEGVKAALVRLAFAHIRPTDPDPPGSDPYVAQIADDLSNADAVIQGILDSAEGKTYRTSISKLVTNLQASIANLKGLLG